MQLVDPYVYPEGTVKCAPTFQFPVFVKETEFVPPVTTPEPTFAPVGPGFTVISDVAFAIGVLGPCSNIAIEKELGPDPAAEANPDMATTRIERIKNTLILTSKGIAVKRRRGDRGSISNPLLGFKVTTCKCSLIVRCECNEYLDTLLFNVQKLVTKKARNIAGRLSIFCDYFSSLKSTCLRSFGSYFISSIRSLELFLFFLV